MPLALWWEELRSHWTVIREKSISISTNAKDFAKWPSDMGKNTSMFLFGIQVGIAYVWYCFWSDLLSTVIFDLITTFCNHNIARIISHFNSKELIQMSS